MEYLIGFGLGAVVSVYARVARFDRERVFYPTLAAVIATYYILFAAMGGGVRAVVVESVIACVFLAVAAVGFRRSLWLIVGALVGHGLFDFVHDFVIENPGMPKWWPGFCGSIDLFLGGYLALLLNGRFRVRL